MPARAPSVTQHPASDRNKLRVLREKLASDEASVREVAVFLARKIKEKDLLAELGKENRGYFLAKLNFDGGGMLSKDMQSLRNGKKLQQLTDSYTKWMEGGRLLPDEKTPERIVENFVDFIMDALKVVSMNECALRIFTGFVVRSLDRLRGKRNFIDLLFDLGIVADKVDAKSWTSHEVKPLQLLTTHFFLDRLYGSDIGSSTVNFCLCVMKTTTTDAKNEKDEKDVAMTWPFRDSLADRLPGWNRVPGCSVDDKNRILAPTSTEGWNLAIKAAKLYLGDGCVNNGIDDAVASPEETLEHFSALAQSHVNSDTALLTVRDLFDEGVPSLLELRSSNTSGQVPWRPRALELTQAISHVANQSISSGSAPQARLSHAASMTAGANAIYPIALGFAAHSSAFLKWTKDCLELRQLGEDMIAALTRAVSEVESGAPMGDLDPRFSGRQINLGCLNVTKKLVSGNFGTFYLGASRESPQCQVAIKVVISPSPCLRSLVSMFLMDSPNVSRLLSYDSYEIPPQSIRRANGNSRFPEKDTETPVCTVLFLEAASATLSAELRKRNDQSVVSIAEVVIGTLKNAVQILNGLVAIHSIGCYNLDLDSHRIARGHHGQLQIFELGKCLFMESGSATANGGLDVCAVGNIFF
jgi:hypothetical protein